MTKFDFKSFILNQIDELQSANEGKISFADHMQLSGMIHIAAMSNNITTHEMIELMKLLESYE